jgi:hypothetical protein
MEGQYHFKKVGNFRFDPSLVRGWYLVEDEVYGGGDSNMKMKKLIVLYDGYQLPFEDDEGDNLAKWLDNTLMKNSIKKSTESPETEDVTNTPLSDTSSVSSPTHISGNSEREKKRWT